MRRAQRRYLESWGFRVRGTESLQQVRVLSLFSSPSLGLPSQPFPHSLPWPPLLALPGVSLIRILPWPLQARAVLMSDHALSLVVLNLSARALLPPESEDEQSENGCKDGKDGGKDGSKDGGKDGKDATNIPLADSAGRLLQVPGSSCSDLDWPGTPLEREASMRPTPERSRSPTSAHGDDPLGALATTSAPCVNAEGVLTALGRSQCCGRKRVYLPPITLLPSYDP